MIPVVILAAVISLVTTEVLPKAKAAPPAAVRGVWCVRVTSACRADVAARSECTVEMTARR